MPISFDDNEKFEQLLKNITVRNVEIDKFEKVFTLVFDVSYPILDDLGNEHEYTNVWQFKFDKFTDKLSAQEIESEESTGSTTEIDPATLEALRGELRILRALAAFYINSLGY
jgi:hypothetical protein